MNLFSKVLAGAIAATTLISSPALAIYPHIERQNPSKESIDRLIERSAAVGVTFFTEESGPAAAEVCNKSAFGMANTDKQFLICLGRHADDWEELTDTLRHELIHVAQGCKGNGQALEPLIEGKEQEYLDYADGYLGWPIALGYEPELWEIEAEAFTMAHLLTPEDVGDLVVHYCSAN